jgi:hypothetical protein
VSGEQSVDIEATLREMVDREAIVQTLRRYALGVDLRDWDLFRSVFTDQLEVDFSSFSGNPPYAVAADDWVAGVRRLSGLQATQHLVVPYTITFHGPDEAECIAYVCAQHFLPNDRGDNWFWVGGYYTDTAVRTPQGWKLRKVKLTASWTAGNRQVFDLAYARYAAMQQSQA